MKGILGRKIGMTQVFATGGRLVPVTVVEVQPNVVLQVLTKEKQGYDALQLAVEDKRVNLVSKPDQGQFKKANTTPKRFVKEIRNMNGYYAGDIIKADIFTAGEFVDVTGISKGKGFTGSIKRHNYSRGPMGHGSGYHRGVGSMGAIAPNRILKSKKMPGHMGAEQVTIQNLEIIAIDVEKNALLVKGSIPGPKKQFVIVKEAIKGLTPNTPTELLVRTVEPTPESKVEVKEEQAPAPVAPVEDNQTVETPTTHGASEPASEDAK
ncbi:50S ribosomal protein L3 [Spiroplasma mirum ATCC 29335]|uniref:Large ribosomal subunit protein uL3 n=1 Tax=Spiroplasma mirum ATCC 29335 TaxID=838561 RepID=W0GQB3_9MOLU|nr:MULTISPECIES: 50S ribosomal protein L3 [Spiroplasma]AHF60726.1 50S ribosomal protein L3 [Spiroplasma mirum ATCC 29335]AHI57354.1 50S ribosomal protein L3 [Spiroplasma mirum ATCC 29335]AKM52844.1 50S ribosomal protein L3 [Spiroplasma atrichopogonis]